MSTKIAVLAAALALAATAQTPGPRPVSPATAPAPKPLTPAEEIEIARTQLDVTQAQIALMRADHESTAANSRYQQLLEKLRASHDAAGCELTATDQKWAGCPPAKPATK